MNAPQADQVLLYSSESRQIREAQALGLVGVAWKALRRTGSRVTTCVGEGSVIQIMSTGSNGNKPKAASEWMRKERHLRPTKHSVKVTVTTLLVQARLGVRPAETQLL